MEATDVSAGEYPDVYAISGERIKVEVDGDVHAGTVIYVPTGEAAVGELEARLREYVRRTGIELEGTGDLAIDVANSLVSGEWQSRWPKRPRWLATRLHGDGPVRFTRA